MQHAVGRGGRKVNFRSQHQHTRSAPSVKSGGQTPAPSLGSMQNELDSAAQLPGLEEMPSTGWNVCCPLTRCGEEASRHQTSCQPKPQGSQLPGLLLGTGHWLQEPSAGRPPGTQWQAACSALAPMGAGSKEGKFTFRSKYVRNGPSQETSQTSFCGLIWPFPEVRMLFNLFLKNHLVWSSME